EFVDGQTLAQWMIDNPKPALETVRGIVEQVARGLQAFHRLEMVHQDLRPENIMIDRNGTAKIIDFGATRIAGIADDTSAGLHDDILAEEIFRRRVLGGAGIFPRRVGIGAIRHIFARRDRLSDADRRAALWRAGGEDANQGPATEIALQVGAARGA